MIIDGKIFYHCCTEPLWDYKKKWTYRFSEMLFQRQAAHTWV